MCQTAEPAGADDDDDDDDDGDDGLVVVTTMVLVMLVMLVKAPVNRWAASQGVRSQPIICFVIVCPTNIRF